jgi:hypothetical protein
MKPKPLPNVRSEDLGDDLLCGADQIAKFLFGASGSRRRVYYLAASSRIPVFRLGTKLCARRSVLLQYIAAQENRALVRAADETMSSPQLETV